MDRVYVRLEADGIESARQLATNLGMNADYVQELLEDLHLDQIVGRAGELYYVLPDGLSYVRLH